MKKLMIAIMILAVAGIADAAGPAFAPTGRATGTAKATTRTIQQSLDAISREIERPKNRPTDPPPAATGGGAVGPFGRTCKEARERMRWSDLPCSPFMPAE